MKNHLRYAITALLLLCPLIFYGYDLQNTNNALLTPSNPHASEEVKLTIYTYESLLADPGYDFIEGYANYSGLTTDQIQVVFLDDANSILTRAVLEKDTPQSDVLIGLDNILIHSAKANNILESYSSPNLVNISSDLIENLDPDHYLLPYDYGIIALYFNQQRINSSSNPELDNLTLDNIITYNLDQSLIVEDPTLSSPGLGFLLWTIAVYGDPTINFEGILGQDWRIWWNNASEDLRIAPSWGAAFNEWYEESGNRSIMVSYGTSPAYSACLYDDPTQKAIVSHENNSQQGWVQIEGIGLTKNAPHKAEAQKFIDWFLDEELQSQIAENNWMYPANTKVELSQTFKDNSLNSSEVSLLNNLISSDMIAENLEMWKEDWEIAIAGDSGNKLNISGFSFIYLLVISGIGIVYISIKLRKN